jgi:hypothetical protein
MSFEVDVAKRLGEAEIAARVTAGGLTALFGPRARQDLGAQHGRRTDEARQRAGSRIGGDCLFDAATGVDLPPERAVSAMSSRTGGCFRTAACAPTCSMATRWRTRQIAG